MNDPDTGMNNETKSEESSRQQLLEMLTQAELSVLDLVQDRDLSLSELAKWFGRIQNVSTLEQIVRLTELRGQMLLAQYRSNAVLRLIEMTASDQPVETARKACVDLLRADLNPFTRLSTDDNQTQSDDVFRLNEKELLAELERLGCES